MEGKSKQPESAKQRGNVKRNTLMIAAILFVAPVLFVAQTSTASSPQLSGSPNEKTAEQVFRNIQALRGVPASQLQQVMALFTASLGVRCTHCHAGSFDKDDKPAKQTARRMIKMVLDLNRATFAGQEGVSCYTCHRGDVKPNGVVALGKNLFLPQPVPARLEGSLPTIEQVLDRYVQALGGKERLDKLTSRVSKGSRVGADGVLVPEEVYQKAPNKMLVITRYPDSAMTTRVAGDRAWAGGKDQQNEIIGEELVELIREATFNKESSIKDLYSSLSVSGRAIVGDRDAYVLEATTRAGNPERLYFDIGSGLLIRRYRESKTALGRFPLQVEFDDYQVVDGVKVPLTIRWSMPGRVWGRRIAEVTHNVAVEDERFTSLR